jgi:hypothetical protein
MDDYDKIVDFHIPQLIKMKNTEWRLAKKTGIAPPPDGIRVNPSGKREEFWYRRTLLDWRRSNGQG